MEPLINRFVPLALLLLVAGCLPTGVHTPGQSLGVGVLVQATAGRCTHLLIGEQVERVCAPRLDGAQPSDTATSNAKDTDADAVR